jgi:uncharacterized membrane protein YkvA (DUF1232 family)
MTRKMKFKSLYERLGGIWKVCGKPASIDEFIEDGSNRLDAIGFLDARRSLIDRLREKLENSDFETFPELGEAVERIIEVLNSPEAFRASDPLPQKLAEAAFGARYLLKRFDLIEDHLPEIGLADDALLLARILERNSIGDEPPFRGADSAER